MSLENPEDYLPLGGNIPTPPMIMEMNSEVDKIYSPAPRFIFTPPADPQPNTTIPTQPSYYYPAQNLHQQLNSAQQINPVTINYPPSSRNHNGRSSNSMNAPIVFYPSAPSTSLSRPGSQAVETLTHPVWQIPKPRRSPNEMVRRTYQPTPPTYNLMKNNIQRVKSKAKQGSNLPSARTILLEDILASQLQGMSVNNWMFRIEQLLRSDQPSAWKQCL